MVKNIIEILYEAIPGGVTHLELRHDVHSMPRISVEFIYDESIIRRNAAILAAVKKLETAELADPKSLDRFDAAILEIIGIIK
jgi:hypothetical protein